MWIFLKILLSSTLTLVLGIKLAEICCHIVIALRSRDSEATSHGSPASTETKSEAATASSGGAWPITSRLQNARSPVIRMLQRVLFRYRTLMLAEAIVASFSTISFIVVSSAIVLFAGTWIEILRILIDRLTFGHKDDYFRGGLGILLSPTNSSYKALRSPARQVRLRNFVRLFLQILALTIVAYAAMYCALDTTYGDKGAFDHVPHTAEKFLHLLYFSTVTIATVGYGDITPREDCLLARMLAGSEILAGLAMLVVLVTCVSLTFSEEATNERTKTD